MKKSVKIIIIVAVCLGVLAGVITLGFKFGIQPIVHLEDVTTFYLDGNSKEYALKRVEPINSTLKGKDIIFLGSSVTYGSKAQGCAFPDYLEKRCGCNSIKEAVSGTTLVDNGTTSYVSRLKRIKAKNADLLVCQLSTNDASKQLPLGEISDSFDIRDFDTGTIAGAIEYIIAYSRDKWDCPVLFFTNPEYDNPDYDYMVTLLLEIQKKWDIDVLDMWNDTEFNAISYQLHELYMADDIHPTKAGYFKWWLPEFIKASERALAD